MGKGVVKLGEGQWAVKDGNLLAAKETNGRFKNAEFTVTRGSDATYVGRDGLIKRFLTGSETELITNSDFSTSGDVTTSSFDLGWKINVSDNLGVSIVNNQLLLSRPVGENTDYGRVYATNGVDSINVKPANHEGRRYKLEFEIVAKTGTPTLRWYNNGFITFTDTTLGKKTIYFTSSTNRLVVFLQEHEGSSITLDNISLIDVEDIDDTPRIDFTDNTDGHLLLEPQSTNLITYSEDFSSYTKSSIDLNDSLVSSPNGSNSATGLTNTTTAQCHIRTSFTTSSTGNYTGTIYIKRQDFDYIYVELGNAYARFDILNGTKGASGQFETGWTYVNHDIETLSNGWFRISITANNTITGTYNFRPYQPTSTFSNYDSGSLGTSFIWGAQVEALPYATSYIPTNGGTVTRDAETCTGAGEAADFNSSEGVLYAEINPIAVKSSSGYIGLLGASAAHRVILGFPANSNDVTYFVISGTTLAQQSYDIGDMNQYLKIALKYKQDDFALWVNGTEVLTDAGGTPDIDITHLGFYGYTTNQPFYGKVKAIRVYKETDGIDLATLTSQ